MRTVDFQTCMRCSGRVVPPSFVCWRTAGISTAHFCWQLVSATKHTARGLFALYYLRMRGRIALLPLSSRACSACACKAAKDCLLPSGSLCVLPRAYCHPLRTTHHLDGSRFVNSAPDVDCIKRHRHLANADGLTNL